MPKSKKQLRVGSHMSISGGVHEALERGAASGCDVVQIFSKSNQQWKSKPLTDEDIEAWQAVRETTGVEPSMVHTSYLINMAAPDSKKWWQASDALIEEYNRCAVLDIPYLVIHPGAHMGEGEAKGIRRIADAIDRLHQEAPDNSVTLLLENTAGQGTSLGCRFEHLRDILAAAKEPERLGVCIDTCHTLAAGYDIRDAEGWQKTFRRFGRLVGTRKIKAFHVNDSKKPLDSHVDRHDHLGRGHLGLGAFHQLVNDRRFIGLPMTLETPKPSEHADPINLAILRCLHGRKRVTARARRLAAQELDQPPLS